MESLTPAPAPSYRLIPSRFPPIGLFDTVATAADLQAVMELCGWTNDRLVVERLSRLQPSEWVYGRPNASVVMASFLHAAPLGMRFNGSGLGAWYAAANLTTAVVEVGHHLRREAVATNRSSVSRTFRTYTALLKGSYLDLRGQMRTRPDVYASESYEGGQELGERIRAYGGDGVVYDSVRHVGGVNVVAYRPHNVEAVTQTDHYAIKVFANAPRIEARRLASALSPDPRPRGRAGRRRADK